MRTEHQAWPRQPPPPQARTAAGPADCPPVNECPACDTKGTAAAAKGKSGGGGAAAPNKYSVTLDLREVLGEGLAIDGLNWKAGTCMPPWKGTNDDVAAGMEPKFVEVRQRLHRARLQGCHAHALDLPAACGAGCVLRPHARPDATARLCPASLPASPPGRQVLARELAKLPGAPKSPATDATIFQLAGVESVWDEGFAALRRRVTTVVATFGLDFGGKTWFCGCGKPSADAGPGVPALLCIGGSNSRGPVWVS